MSLLPFAFWEMSFYQFSESFVGREHSLFLLAGFDNQFLDRLVLAHLVYHFRRSKSGRRAVIIRIMYVPLTEFKCGEFLRYISLPS